MSILLLICGIVIALGMGILLHKSAPQQAETPTPPTNVMDLGDGWHAAWEYASPEILQRWEADQRGNGLVCRFMGLTNTNITGRLGYSTSPPTTENLYLCREKAIPAQDCTVE